MKKIFVFIVVVMIAVSLTAEIMKPLDKTAIVRDNVLETRKVSDTSSMRMVPEFEFSTDPVSIITNYYDYMPGSYNGSPVQMRPDEFGGVYLIFHARETPDATRREYYAYIDAAGNMLTGTIGVDDVHEGYAGIDIDPVSGNPIAAWHVNSDGAGNLEVVATWDLAHISPGLWITPFDVITDDLPSPGGTSDEFIWPYVQIGPSPDPEKRRVYIQANNAYSASDPTENPMIAYADFESTDLGNTSNLEWTYFTIETFDNWNQSNPEWVRPFHSFAVSEYDGRIAFFGYNSNDELYVAYNDNYGEGNWTFDFFDIGIDTFNPQNTDGSYVFTDEDGNPYDLNFAPVHAGHQTAVFTDMGETINMGGTLGLSVAGGDSYYPYEIFPYTFQYDFETNEFHYWIQDYEVNENANDPDYVYSMDEVYVPWDTDRDDEVDEFSEEGLAMMYNGWPIYFWDSDTAFHENLFKMGKNDENDWIVNVWQEALYSKYYNDSGDEDYVDWASVSQIYITASQDGGSNWSEPIIMNAKADDENYEEKFADMMPCYLYISDEIEDVGEGWGRVHMMFLDDDSFGSYIQTFGQNDGGTMKYAALDIEFSQIPTSSNPATVTPSVANVSQNYPNPFNPTTTISYSIDNASDVTIEVYNVKGQQVKTLVDEHKTAGEHTVVWNGTDNSNRSVSSGIYFYKMKAGGKYTSTKKMILLK